MDAQPTQTHTQIEIRVYTQSRQQRDGTRLSPLPPRAPRTVVYTVGRS